MSTASGDDGPFTWTFAGIREADDPSLANAFRRSILSDVPTLAPCAVTFKTNSSVMSDKQLAHRISLVVLASDRMDASPSLRLVCGQKNTRQVITASAIVVPEGVRIVTPSVPLVILDQGQSIEAEIHTKIAGGGCHARHCPATVVHYQPTDSGVALTIEPTGAISPQEILRGACNALLHRLELCRKHVNAT